MFKDPLAARRTPGLAEQNIVVIEWKFLFAQALQKLRISVELEVEGVAEASNEIGRLVRFLASQAASKLLGFRSETRA